MAEEAGDEASGADRRGQREPRAAKRPRSMTWAFFVERVTRIELALSAWEADVLPLNYTRVRRRPESVSERAPTVPNRRPPVFEPRGLMSFRGGRGGCGGRELGRTVGASRRVRAGPECRLEGRLFDPVLWLLSSGKQQPDAALGEGTQAT